MSIIFLPEVPHLARLSPLGKAEGPAIEKDSKFNQIDFLLRRLAERVEACSSGSLRKEAGEVFSKVQVLLGKNLDLQLRFYRPIKELEARCGLIEEDGYVAVSCRTSCERRPFHIQESDRVDLKATTDLSVIKAIAEVSIRALGERDIEKEKEDIRRLIEHLPTHLEFWLYEEIGRINDIEESYQFEYGEMSVLDDMSILRDAAFHMLKSVSKIAIATTKAKEMDKVAFIPPKSMLLILEDFPELTLAAQDLVEYRQMQHYVRRLFRKMHKFDRELISEQIANIKGLAGGRMHGRLFITEDLARLRSVLVYLIDQHYGDEDEREDTEKLFTSAVAAGAGVKRR